MKSLDVIIPVYKPDKKFTRLLQMLQKQTYPIHRIIIMNTEQAYWNEAGYKGIRGLEVHHLAKEEFDHGATRDLAAWYSEADIMVFMTDDAVPADEYLLERLAHGLERQEQDAAFASSTSDVTAVSDGEGTSSKQPQVAMAYARQLPAKGCHTIERYTRAFNYPDQSVVKTAADLPRLGIKTYFASNACCAYNKEIFRKLEGFTRQTIFNEDMIYAAGAIKAGYAIAYVADAQVIHSHNFTPCEQFKRNFDLAVSQADNPEIFDSVPSEGEGIRLVKKTARYLLRTGRVWLLPTLVISSGCKYLGYRLGRRYRLLPHKLILKCTSNPMYWLRRKGWDKA